MGQEPRKVLAPLEKEEEFGVFYGIQTKRICHPKNSNYVDIGQDMTTNYGHQHKRRPISRTVQML